MRVNEITVAGGAVIEDVAGKVLLVRHVPARGGFWQGKWICPGGSVRVGESIEDAIQREVMEETNLEIKLTRSLVPFERIVKSGDRVDLHVIYIDYLAEVVGGELRPDDDVGEAIWVSRDGLRKIWEDLHPDTKRLLKIAKIV